MRAARLMTLATAVVLAACGSSVARSSSAANPPCVPKAAATLASSHVARVYAVHGNVFGCSAHGSTSYRLGRRDSCLMATRIAPVVVTGEVAAYGAEECGIDTGSTLVVVRRLTDGKQLMSATAATPPGPESYESVDSLVLKRDGAVAWIAVGRSIVGTRGRSIEVDKSDKHGGAVLDSGGAIGVYSLRLRQSTLRWRDGTQTRSATLH
jgi:hypothetical protein